MDRLTKVIDGSVVFPSELVGVTLTPDNEIMYKLLTRLAAYEDKGVMPEDTLSALEMAKAACKLMVADAYIATWLMPERVAELARAEKDGRLVVLPQGKAQWLKAILDERERQDQKWGFPQENTYGEWGSILSEEAGELCKELNELNFGRGDPEKMETEAVQVAAVALSILEHATVALGVTEQVAKALCRRPTRPKCFYGDADLCRGMSVNNDDEPIEDCKRCWYCSAGYRQLEAEEAVEREEGTHEMAEAQNEEARNRH